ncbi:hypothetical protein [Primorskyibacter sp. S87]|uniref:hypothetical protein n=1 Tax=Primorskyibacter sp. S87 TaxID=3415126 RepID=UPI003C7CC39B
MRTKIMAAGLITGLAAATLFAADMTSAQTKPTQPGTTGNEFVISCYRGPWRDTVALDRPNAVFLDELMEYGYTPTQAISIGKRVCRDEYGVRNPEHLKATLAKLIKEQPPRR